MFVFFFFTQHCCKPNVFVQSVFVDTHDLRFPWVAFFAMNYIRAGTELTWDYNYHIDSVPGRKLYCHCGAKECKGRLLWRHSFACLLKLVFLANLFRQYCIPSYLQPFLFFVFPCMTIKCCPPAHFYKRKRKTIGWIDKFMTCNTRHSFKFSLIFQNLWIGKKLFDETGIGFDWTDRG